MDQVDSEQAAAFSAELTAMREKNPEQFAAMLAQCLGPDGEEGGGGTMSPELMDAWQRALSGDDAPQVVRDNEIELPGNKVLGETGLSRQKDKGLKIVPTPGFAIKTRQLSGTPMVKQPGVTTDEFLESAARDGEGSDKVFINICTHEHIGQPKTQKKLDDEGKEVEGVNIPLSIGAPRLQTDKSGGRCVAVDCIINPTVLAEAIKDTTGAEKNFICQLALNYVEQKHNCKLDQQYKLPKLRYKGDAAAPDPQWVRDTRSEPKIEEVASEAAPAPVPREKRKPRPKQPPPPCCAFYQPPPEGVAVSLDEVDVTDLAARAGARVAFDATIGAAHDGAVCVDGAQPPMFDALAAHADRPAVLVYEIGEVDPPGARQAIDGDDTKQALALDVSALALKLRLPGRERLELSLPFAVEPSRAAATLDAVTRRLTVLLPVDPAPIDGGADPGSQPWLISNAIRDPAAEAAEAAEAQAAVAPPKSVHERFHLNKVAVANAPALPVTSLGASVPKGQRKFETTADIEEMTLPEERFHQKDIMSQHYITQRESSVDEKRKRAEEEREQNKDDPNVEYIDFDDYRPGGKFASAEDGAPEQKAALPAGGEDEDSDSEQPTTDWARSEDVKKAEEVLARVVSESAAAPGAAVMSSLSSSLWAELL